MNALAPLHPQQQARVWHVYHNVTQQDPNMRLQGLRYYAPQMDVMEKAALFNIMRPNWGFMCDEERRLYLEMARSADPAFDGGVGSVADDYLSLSPEEFVNKYKDKIGDGEVFIKVDVSSLAPLGWTGANPKEAAPHKSLHLFTKITPASGYEDEWKMATQDAAKAGMLGFLLQDNWKIVNASDFQKFRNKELQLADVLTTFYRARGGKGKVTIAINAEARWYDWVPTIWNDGVDAIAKTVKEYKKAIEKAANVGANALADTLSTLLKYGLIVGGVGVMLYIGTVLGAARLLRPQVSISTPALPSPQRRAA